jgi:hypothetical protein
MALARITSTLMEALQRTSDEERQMMVRVLTDVRVLYHQLKV